MAQPPGRIVIRTYAPLRRWLLIGGAALLGGLLLYVTYEWGRANAAREGLAATALRAGHEARIDELEAANRELRLKNAAQENAQAGQKRERAEVERTIGELQAQVARQEQDLAFYRGIAGDVAALPPVRIQQFRVVPLGAARRYSLRLVLGRPVRPEDVVTGTLAISVEGTQADKVASLDLAELTGKSERELRFNYRYLQTFELDIGLPDGFAPERTTVEIKVARKGAEPVRQTYLWSVEES